MKKNIGSMLMLLCLAQISYAQESVKEKKWTYNFGLGILNTGLKNENITNDETLNTESKNHPMIEFNLSRKLGDIFNFSTGLVFLQYSSFSESSGVFQSGTRLTDADGFDYYPYYETDFRNEKKVSTLGIPIGFKVLTGKPGKTSLHLEIGIQPTFVLSAKFDQTGSYERKGLYPDPQYYNFYYLLSDIDRLDYKVYNQKENSDLETNSFLINGYIGVGISAPISDKIDLYVKGYFTKGLQDITSDENKDEPYYDVMGLQSEYKKTTLFAEGIVVGILLR
jgi:hypothetical protein